MNAPTSISSVAPRTLTFWLLIGFLTTGAIPLLSPHFHYQLAWPTFLRYSFILAAYGLLALGTIANKRHVPVANIAIFVAFSLCLLLAWMAGVEPHRVTLYFLPLIAIFTPPSVFRMLPRLALWVFPAVVLGLIYEAWAGTFGRFYGVRFSSIFVNPNNLAIVVVIGVALVCHYGRSRSVAAAFAIASTPVVLLSGSKTGLLMLVALGLFYVARHSRKAVLAAMIAGVAVAAIGVYAGVIREPSLSLTERFLQLYLSLSDIETWFIPAYSPQPLEYYLTNPYIYVDNVFIETWIELGVPAAILFAAVFAWKANRDRLASPFWVILAVAGLTTNINYTWPVAYFLWAYIGQPKAQA